MKTLFCLADIHGFYDEMMLALNEAKYDINNPNHIIIHCGDLLDRGSQPLECLKFINSIPSDRKVLIRGNHEDLLEDIFAREYFMWHDISNGTAKTVYDLSDFMPEKSEFIDHLAIQDCSKNEELVKYLKSLVDYFEVDNYIFVHGWIPIYSRQGIHIDSISRNSGEWKYGDWRKARWYNGMEKWSQGEIILDKTIVCGHWHTSWGHAYLHNNGVEWDDEYYENYPTAFFTPFIDKNIIALDACTAYSNMVNCYKIEIEDDKCQLNM